MSWSPQQYLKFEDARLRPALDLLARVDLDNPRRIYDLGCGTGNVTRLLAERWPHAHVVGVDNSAAMLAAAAAKLPQIEWRQQHLADWRAPEPADLIYSNAALHWLPDHDRLLPALVESLAGDGVLAVQMPRNFSAPSHTLIGETVRAGPWRARLESLLGDSPVAAPERYYEWLAPHARRLDLWETEYLQVLEGEDPVKEWTKGTWLRQFLERLDPAEALQFERDYAQRLRAAYPRRADGKTLFPFRRLFLVLKKAGVERV